MQNRSSITIKGRFDTVFDQLLSEFESAGFNVCGTLVLAVGEKHHNTILLDLPWISSKILALSQDVLVLPVCVSVVEIFLGSTEITIVNPTEMLAAERINEPVFYLAKEMTNEIERLIQKVGRIDNITPDVVTSWGL